MRCTSTLAAMLVVTLLSPDATAQATAAPRPSEATETPWNTGTALPPPTELRSDNALSLRVYGDEDSRAPLRDWPGQPGRDDPAYAVDVSAVMSHCANGQLLITALVIGGRLTPLDVHCPDQPVKNPPASAPQCDAKRWTCATAPGN